MKEIMSWLLFVVGATFMLIALPLTVLRAIWAISGALTKVWAANIAAGCDDIQRRYRRR